MTPDLAFVLEMAGVVCLVVLIVVIVAAAAGACDPVASLPGRAAVHDVEQALGPATLVTYDQARRKAAGGKRGTGASSVLSLSPAEGKNKAGDGVVGGGGEEEAPWCAICLSEYAQGDELVRVLPACGHFFHADCRIDWWLRHRGTCPLCRGVLRPVPACSPMPPRVAGAATGRSR